MGIELVPTKFCCVVRAHFLMAIIGKTAENDPPEVADFITQWEPNIVIGIKFCPFCGKPLERDQTLRTTRLS